MQRDGKFEIKNEKNNQSQYMIFSQPPEKNEQMLQILDILGKTIEKTYKSKKYAIVIGILGKEKGTYMYGMGAKTKPKDFGFLMCECISTVWHNENGCSDKEKK